MCIGYRSSDYGAVFFFNEYNCYVSDFLQIVLSPLSLLYNLEKNSERSSPTGPLVAHDHNQIPNSRPPEHVVERTKEVLVEKFVVCDFFIHSILNTFVRSDDSLHVSSSLCCPLFIRSRNTLLDFSMFSYTTFLRLVSTLTP